MKISGYTLHGDYYLADNVIIEKNWKEACEMKEKITLPNGKMVIAHTLSKEELESISQEERKCDKWYWTSTPYNDNHTLYVWFGKLYNQNVNIYGTNGGARLGFHKNEIKQHFLDVE